MRGRESIRTRKPAKKAGSKYKQEYPPDDGGHRPFLKWTFFCPDCRTTSRRSHWRVARPVCPSCRVQMWGQTRMQIGRKTNDRWWKKQQRLRDENAAMLARLAEKFGEKR